MLDDWLFKGFVVLENWDGRCAGGGCWLALRNISSTLAVDVETGFGLLEGNSCFLRLTLRDEFCDCWFAAAAVALSNIPIVAVVVGVGFVAVDTGVACGGRGC